MWAPAQTSWDDGIRARDYARLNEMTFTLTNNSLLPYAYRQRRRRSRLDTCIRSPAGKVNNNSEQSNQHHVLTAAQRTICSPDSKALLLLLIFRLFDFTLLLFATINLSLQLDKMSDNQWTNGTRLLKRHRCIGCPEVLPHRATCHDL